ncbi:Folylpolyglutamate synthetase [Kickxella alabastrina]|uniref:Folylpolyglutamate synthetase n=1 Tax=Kickxella alabastrina TaxID=61397 RepID=A0ACC1IWP5_9FUNG|nr:Folylpolyglutamate synthetase [Kickxella alabastrina]
MQADESYLSAVRDLNGLQTNYQIIQQIKASGGRINESSIPEFEAFLEKIGHPVADLDRLNVIHVTGTKGKGSTCAFVSSVLQQVTAPEPRPRLKVGLFTSPHLIEVRERIQINGQPLSRDKFAQYFYETFNALRSHEPPLRLVTPESPTMPMYFRFLTLMAFHAFLAEGVDVAVVEVGVGGQYDSTNVVRRPVACGIASLGIDHQGALGSTIREIAWHKAGIIKPHVPVFTVPQPPEAMRVIEQRADDRQAQLSVASYASDTAAGRALGIPGDHQRTNAALAEALSREWIRCKLPDADPCAISRWVADGLRTAHWPGRSQTFVSPRCSALTWHVDGAHTPESMAACAQWFASGSIGSGSTAGSTAGSGSAPCVLLFNAAHDRNAQALLETLWRHTSAECNFVAAVFCPNLSMRADSANFTVLDDQALAAQRESARLWTQTSGCTDVSVMPNINAAVDYVEGRFGAKSSNVPTRVLATGSLHLVGGVLDAAKGSL